ncbi:MAG: 5-formyltetrahydrofolate cyclo-ligase [Frankiales bacterium]|nr:5-formyltetrahydrofolate cyclo-ligase [Frankiales bacterium]
MRVPARPLSKPELRRAAEAARRRLPQQLREDGDRRRAALLAPLLAGARVAAYEPFGTEPVPPLGPDVLVPVLLPDRDLDWRRHGGGPLLGVDAVASCDVVLVPALAVDRTGARLGRGGGSYDRALLRARGRVVALLHEGELVEELPAEAHDVRVHAVALPSGLVPCSATMRP